MADLSDNPALPTAPPDPLHTALADVVKSFGEKLGAALARTSRSNEIESRRQIEQVLGRKLEPLFASELVTLLLVPGNEGRELRAAFVALLSMTDSSQRALTLTRDRSPTAPPDPLHTALADAVKSLGDKLGAALARTSRSNEAESRRQIEQVLGRKLEPLFTLELVTLLLVPGSEGRELRAAFVALLSMTESAQWAVTLTRDPSAMPGPDNEVKFFASEQASCVTDFAHCWKCLARSAAEREGEAITNEEAAKLQWAICAQCRCGTSAWFGR